MWTRAQKVAKRHYNKRRKARSFEKEQKILFSSKNIRVRKPCKKLTDRFLGPFRVVKKIGKNAYQLDLPKQYGKLHHTFHIFLLEPYTKRKGEEPLGSININGDRFFMESVFNERLT